MTHPLVQAIRSGLAKAADPEKAPQMQAYMKSAMPYRGVSSPLVKALCRDVFKTYSLTTVAEWRSVVLELWRKAAFREERYAAILLTQVKRYREFLTFSSLPMHEEMIVTGAWWDVVDTLAGHNLGDILRADPRRMKPRMRQWARDSNMWKRRSAILCQLGFKRDTDLALLYDCIEPNLLVEPVRKGPAADMAREFFIRKAIGWALRQYAWTDPAEVRRYVKANRGRLSPLSVREALKNVGAEAGLKTRLYTENSSLRTRARSRSI